MTNESLSEWEQNHIEILTSRQMGVWLGRRENRLLDEIRAEIEALIEWHDCPIEYDNGNDAWYREACNQALKIINKYKTESEENA